MTWLYPTFLFALFALAIPIIVHLFNFRKYKKIEFTNVRFLRQITKETKSGNQLKKYLVLASRLLALTFLVFAFSQPVLISKNSKIADKKLISLIIDNSFSMSNNNQEGPMLESVKNRARAIVNASSNNDEFIIITSDLNGSLLHKTNKQNTLENIDKIKVGSGSKSINTLLEVQERLVKNSNKTIHQYLISDFQKNDLPGKEPLQDSFIKNYWIKIPSTKLKNISIDSCFLSSPIVLPKQPIELKVTLSNYSDEEIEGLTVELSIDNKPKGIANTNIKPWSKSSVSISFTLDEGGSHQGVIKINNDEINFDDKLFFSLNIKDLFKVINISNDNNIYLNSIYEETQGYNYIKFNSGNVQFNEFPSANLIIVNQIENISNGLVSELKKHLSQGGTCIVFPNKNEPHGGLLQFGSELGLNIGKDYINFNGKINYLDKEHPVFQDVFEKVPKQTDLPNVIKYLNLPSGNSILKMSNGSPFINEYKLGNGRIFICSSPINAEFTNFQNHALFVPFLLKLAMIGQHQSNLYYLCGQTEPIGTDIKFENDIKMSIYSDQYSQIPEQKNADGKLFINTNGEIETAGNYQLKNIPTNQNIMSISFNYNRKESDIKTLSDNELQAEADKYNAELFNQSADKLSAKVSIENKGQPLWKWCIIFVLLFLLIEILLILFFKPNAKVTA